MIACGRCGGKMAATAKVCPHCGHREAPAGMSGVTMSSEEAKALLLMSGGGSGDEDKPVQAYLLPHPRTAPGARPFEALLTVATAPLWALGVFGFAWARMRHRSGSQTPMGEGRAALTMAAFGAPLTYLAGLFALGATAASAITFGMLVLWFARAVIRGGADASTSRALSRLDRGASPAPLPSAAVVSPPETAPAATPSAPRLAPVAAEAPRAVEAAPLEDGPRRLR